MKKEKTQDSNILLFLVVFLILSGLYLVFGSGLKGGEESVHYSSVEQGSGKVNWGRLNQKMQMLEGQKKIQELQQKAKNANLSHDFELDSVRDRAKPAGDYHLDFLSEESAQEVFSDLNHKQYLPDSNKPRDIINAQKNLDQTLNKLDKQYQEEFVKQFVENAKRGGWHVKVSDQMQVLEVRPIKTRGRRPTRVPQSSGDTQETLGSGIN